MTSADTSTSGRPCSAELNELQNSFTGESIEGLIDLIRVAETAERYENMCDLVKKMVELRSSANTELSVEERNLLSVAYKNVVGAKRAAWRTLNGTFEEVDQAMLGKYKEIVEAELEEICMELINLLTSKLMSVVKGNNDV